VFFLQLSRFKHWLMRGPTDAEWARIFGALSDMHWSVSVSYQYGRPVEVRWHDCGFERSSLSLLPERPTTNFKYGSPERHRDPVPADEGFLRACGIRPPDVRDELQVLGR
jgi:hypothetical protein